MVMAEIRAEQVCPRCKTSSYQKPNLKLMVNICGHKLCESCVDVVFTRPSAACPQCGVALRRNQFRLQLFEDSLVEKEVDIRKKILRDYNKVEDDFTTLSEYNDYLEDVESIIFNLSNGIDVETTQRKVEQYKKENQSLIMRNRARNIRNEQSLTKQLGTERAAQDQRNRRAVEEVEEVARARRNQKESLIEELMHSNRPASEVVESHSYGSASVAASVSPASSVRKDVTQPMYHGQQGDVVFEPLPDEVGIYYSYQPLLLEMCGPGVPDLEELESYGYLSNIRELDAQHAGTGFVPGYACQRALQEAFSCLLLNPQELVL